MSTWDHMIRQFNETIDRAILGDPPRGIYSAVPATTEPAPPVTIEDINRTMRQILDAVPRPGPRLELRYGEGVPDQLLVGVEMRPSAPGQPDLNSVWGMPMIPDDRLAPGEWRIVDEFGNVRAVNSPVLGMAMVLNVDMSAAYYPAPDRFARWQLDGWVGARSGDILERIDAAVEGWELGPDAYRYRADDTLE